MFKYLLKNKFFIILICTTLSLSIANAQVSYSQKKESEDNNIEEIETVVEEQTSEEDELDEKIYNFLTSIPKKETEEEKEAREEAKRIAKSGGEDPAKIAAALKNKKGNAKNISAAEARRKYETNETSLGIDVSYAQGKIDWSQVKSSGIHFAMIRAGFRGYGSGAIVKDSQFENNIKGALSNNINVGIYFFTAATNEAEAREEANWVANLIKDYDITFPVAYDTELFADSFGSDPGFDYRLKNISNSQLTNNAIAFSDQIRSRGYTPMIYSYANALKNYFDTARFGNNRIWLAQYNDSVTYKGSYHMWQYTSNGSVPGINTRVDMNVAYFSVTNDVTKSSNVNGINNTNFDNMIFKSTNTKTRLKKDVILRTASYSKIGTLPNNTEVTITGTGTKYTRLIYNGNTYYVEDPDCFITPTINFDPVLIQAKVTKSVNLLNPDDYIKDYGTNIATGNTITITGLSNEYTKVIYNNKTYYVNNTNFYEKITDTKENNNDENDSEKQSTNNVEASLE